VAAVRLPQLIRAAWLVLYPSLSRHHAQRGLQDRPSSPYKLAKWPLADSRAYIGLKHRTVSWVPALHSCVNDARSYTYTFSKSG
jgi:hypothetical protein